MGANDRFLSSQKRMTCGRYSRGLVGSLGSSWPRTGTLDVRKASPSSVSKIGTMPPEHARRLMAVSATILFLIIHVSHLLILYLFADYSA